MDDSDGGAALGIGECSDSDREGRSAAPVFHDILVGISQASNSIFTAMQERCRAE